MRIPRLKTRQSRPPSLPDDDLLASALPERASIAHERLAHQYDPALTEALSQRELSAQRELAEKIRDYERGEQLARIEAAQSAADRVRHTRDQLADNEAKDLVRAAQAIAEQRRAASPHAKVARLHRRKNFVLGILTGVVAFAMVFSAVTVQHNIIPNGNPGDLMWWLAYGLETLISGMLIALMISTSDTAEWEVIENPWVVYGIEGVLLAVTVTLNVYPFWKAGDHFGVGVHAIAPITIGTALATHGVVSKRYGDAIAKATAQVPDAEDLTGRLAALTRIGAPEHLPEHPVQKQSTRLDVEQVQSTTAPERSTEHAMAALLSGPPSSPAPEQSTRGAEAEQTDSATQPVAEVADTVVPQQNVTAPGPVLDSSGAAEREASDPSHGDAEKDTAPRPASAEQWNTVAEQTATDCSAEHPATATERSAEHPAPAGDPVEQSAEQRAEHLSERRAEQWSTGPVAEQFARAEQSTLDFATAVQSEARSRCSVERIAEVIERHDATGDGAARIARDLSMGFGTVDKLLTAAAQLRDSRGRILRLHQG